MAIKTYKDKATRDIARGERSKAALKLLSVELHQRARVKLAQLDAASNIMELRRMRSLNLEKLKGSRKDQWSVRINNQYRITFLWEGEKVWNVAIEDYHRG